MPYALYLMPYASCLMPYALCLLQKRTRNMLCVCVYTEDGDFMGVVQVRLLLVSLVLQFTTRFTSTSSKLKRVVN